MTPELEALARRAVACEGWRWMPGMLTIEEIVPPAITLGWDAARLLHADEGDAAQVCTVLGKVRDIHDTALPDLNDPATLGCVLALVREAWGDVQFIMTYSPCNGWWNLYFDEHPDRVELVGLSLAEALVAALEAAP